MKLNPKDYEAKMGKAIDELESNFDTIRAGQANPSVLNRVTFEYYGSPTSLSSMADIRLSAARTLVIKPYDSSTLKAMEKAILTSDVGITPANDGSVIRLVFPQLPEERSRELKRSANEYCEDALRRTEEAVAEAYDEIKKSRARFRAASGRSAAANNAAGRPVYDAAADED